MAENREKTYVADVDRSIYDIRDAEHDAYRMESGLTPEIVDKLSKEKGDPVWMQQFRLQSLQIYNELHLPDWGPSLEGLDIDHIATYVRPNTKMQNDWANVPQDIKDTFERLGIPQAERKSLAGVGAQYDSELVYHNVRDEVAAEGVVYADMESALKGEYADMVRKYFMKLVTPRDHKFAALHGAVWSGGSFVYVPKGVHLSIPLQSYFRLNAPGAGQFEHKRTPDEPPVQTPPYYEDVVFCQNRALIQFCRSGHLRVTQMDSGSAIEILPSGDMVVHCEGNMYASVKGNVLEAVEGDYTQKISGSFTQTVEGQMTFSSGGEASFGSTQSSLSLSAKTHGEMTGGGGLTFNGDTTMRDNLTCETHVEAASIHSSGDIIAAGSNSNHHSH